MASSSTVESAPSPAFLHAFREQAGPGRQLAFADFMKLALYHPAVGYYRQARRRVGYGGETDFFTATTSGPLFGELVAACAGSLLSQRDQDPKAFTFVEIGPEPHGGILQGVSHSFAASRSVPVGAPYELTGRCVVFSNELFDAQPCARYVRTESGWDEIWVEEAGGQLQEVRRPLPTPPPDLPAEVPPGYHFDAPRAAATLAGELADQPWQGLFLAFDYGKSWLELATETPSGTARAYHRHRQVPDLLAQPGQQDLTCHVCWDWLTAALQDRGFEVSAVLAQEAFLVTHGSDCLAAIMAAEAGGLSQRKLALLQLLHPAHLGQKFQVLSGWRA